MSIAGNTKIIKSIFQQLPKQIYSLTELYIFLCVKQRFYLKSRMSLDYSSINLSNALNVSPVLCLMDQFEAHFGGFTGTACPVGVNTNELDRFISEFKQFPFDELSRHYVRSDEQNNVRIACTEFVDYKYQYIFMIADLMVHNYTENENLKYMFCMPDGDALLKLRQVDLKEIYMLGDYGLRLISGLVSFDMPYFDFMEAQMVAANEDYAKFFDFTIQPEQYYFVYSDKVKFLTLFKTYSFHKFTFEVLQIEKEGAILKDTLVLTDAEVRKVKIVPVSFLFSIETENGTENMLDYLKGFTQKKIQKRSVLR